MKRRIAMLLTLLTVLLLSAMPAFSEAMSVFDYTDDILEDGCPIYYFPEISLKLPVNWNGKVMAIKGEKGTSFYQTASYEKYQEEGIDGGGFLFMLGASVNSSFSELPSFEYVGFCEDSAMNYYLMLPTDYPAYDEPAIRAEYDAMACQIDYVVAHADIYSEDEASGNDPDRSSEPGSGSGPDRSGEPGSGSGPESNSGPGSTWPDAAEALFPSSGVESMDSFSAEAEEQLDEGWTPQEVRYQFEHSMLPRYFYEVPENMLYVMEEDGVYELWAITADENGADPYYPEEDYEEHWYEAEDGTTVLQINMPEPDANVLCYRVYMLFNGETGDRGYYTVEYDEFLTDSSFICFWDEERNHSILDAAPVLDRDSDEYEEKLQEEAEQVAQLAGISGSLTPLEASDGIPSDASAGTSADEPADTTGLAEIECPEMGFSTMADPAYSWEYEEGTGVYIFTEEEGVIPYVIVYKAEDLLAEPFEYIQEQFTPYMEDKYGEDLVNVTEIEDYEIGGGHYPAALYTYKLQGYLIDMWRIYDSTGDQTVAYTAKYIEGEGGETHEALDTAIRCFKAE